MYPDTSLILNAEATDIIARLLPPKLASWRSRRDRRQAIKDKKKKRKLRKKEALMKKRREEIVKEIEEKKAARKAEREAEAEEEEEEDSDAEKIEEEEEEEEEEVDIDAMLAEEFEEEEEEEDEEEEETEEDAIEHMKNDLNEVYDNDVNTLADVQDKLGSILIPRTEVDAGRKPHIVRYVISKKLRSIVTNRASIFERPQPIPEKLAERMLKLNYKYLSRFGRWCPVQVSFTFTFSLLKH